MMVVVVVGRGLCTRASVCMSVSQSAHDRDDERLQRRRTEQGCSGGHRVGQTPIITILIGD